MIKTANSARAEQNAPAPSGLLLFNKKAGITSFEALREIKRALGTGKVGHTGTLDKFAEGLLVVLSGQALKLSQWFSNCDKQYLGSIRFGIETDTLDPEGNTVFEAPLPSREAVEKVLEQFTGDIQQEPPAYSAIHVDGQRASDLARKGQTPVMKKRPVHIYRLELGSWDPPLANIFVHCSSGTYIRSLARDIAIAAGSRAHLAGLLRTRVAGFKLEDAWDCKSSAPALRPIDKAVISALGFPWFEVSAIEAEKIFHGKPLPEILNNKSVFPQGKLVSDFPAAVFSGDELIAIVEKNGGKWKYGCVFGNCGISAGR